MSPSATRLVDVSVEPVAWPAHVPDGRSNSQAPDGTWLVELDEAPARHTAADRAADHDRQIYARGYADGQQAAAAAAELRSQAQARRLAAAIAEIANLRRAVMQRAERDAVRLALAIAARIVHDEIKRDPAQIAAIARHAAARLGDRVEAVVRLNADDLDAVRGSGVDVNATATVQLVADPQLASGACIVESAAGRVDAGVDAQIREITAQLFDEAEGAANAGAPDA